MRTGRWLPFSSFLALLAAVSVLQISEVHATFVPPTELDLYTHCQAGSPMLSSDICWGRTYDQYKAGQMQAQLYPQQAIYDSYLEPRQPIFSPLQPMMMTPPMQMPYALMPF